MVAAVAAALTACGNGNQALSRATAQHPDGRAVFDHYNCTRCHEEGDGGYGPKLIGDPKLSTLAFIKFRIVNGRAVGGAQMPPFPLQPDDLNAVAHFVHALAGFE